MTLFKKMISTVGLTLLLLTLLGCSHENKECNDDDAECMLSKITASYDVEFLGNDIDTRGADDALQSQRINGFGALILDKSGSALALESTCRFESKSQNTPKPNISVGFTGASGIDKDNIDDISYSGNCYQVYETGNFTVLYIPTLDNPKHGTEGAQPVTDHPHSMQIYVYRGNQNGMTYRVFHRDKQFSNNGAHDHDGDGSHSHDKDLFEVLKHNTTHGGGIGT
ncbi:hypothetical protein [Alteromonas lipotrueae]|uniref:hypothetical protein n=1 Tax=Alteromonas lipotrueae TaxID=2803814 RepID=UPI001C43EF92|nr:hypothetical protein [Alteromonas lipotrueae]